MVGNNTPIFFIRDPQKVTGTHGAHPSPLLPPVLVSSLPPHPPSLTAPPPPQFPDFIHTQKRHPQTNLKDPDAFWDFASLVPESVHQFTFLFSDRGIPASYRHMHGFSSHTYKWVNGRGEGYWVKLHYKSDQGVRNFTAQQAAEVERSGDLDYSTRDLFDAIKEGRFPSWTANVQLMPVGEERNYKWNVRSSGHSLSTPRRWSTPSLSASTAAHCSSVCVIAVDLRPHQGLCHSQPAYLCHDRSSLTIDACLCMFWCLRCGLRLTILSSPSASWC